MFILNPKCEKLLKRKTYIKLGIENDSKEKSKKKVRIKRGKSLNLLDSSRKLKYLREEKFRI